jgi:FKBP-type peptidyl-prolyl cis-trans isomerase FklB
MQKLMMMAVILLSASVKSQTKKPAPKPVAKPTVAVTPKPLLRNGLDSLSYAIGVNIGANMKMQGIENLSYVTLNKGISDALKGNKPLMDENQCNMTIQSKLQEYMSKKSGAVKEEGRKFWYCPVAFNTK